MAPQDMEDRGYILSLDAGTSSVRAILYDSFGVAVAMAQRPLRLGFPQAGWVSQDAMEILSRSIACMVEVQVESGIHSDEIRAVGIANQRETVVVWDKASGQPIADAIVWQCRRTAPEVKELVNAGYGPFVQERTGLVIDPYFSATKIAWILDHVEGARERAEHGELLAGTVDTWLVYNFTHGAVHATDYTNASRTMLFDIHTLSWSDELCELFRVPRRMLGEALPSDGDFGRVSSDIFSHHPPIAGVVGDQQSSLFGHLCFDPGMAKNTYGTGCFLLMNVGREPVLSSHGLLCTVGIAAGGEVSYALEGSVFQAGSVVQWLRDELGLIKSAEESAEVARSVPSTNGCYLVPAFTGLGAPWWSSDARGTLTGLTRATNGAEIVRAGLESIAYQSADVLRAMEADCGMPVSELRVDGGAATNDFLMGFQADILTRPVVRPGAAERTALGAAYLAGLSVGYWQSVDDLAARQAGEHRWEPSMSAEERDALLAGWNEAVHRTLAQPPHLFEGVAMKIAIASDHAGFEQKAQLAPWLAEEGYEVLDFGPENEDRVDYPDFAYKVASAVAAGEADRGVLVCGTGLGMEMGANKVPGIRAAAVQTPEFAELMRAHNDANVLCLSGRFVGLETNEDLCKIFLTTPFEGGRHAGRTAKLDRGCLLEPRVQVVRHPLVAHKLSILRSQDTPTKLFRELIRELALFLGYEATRDFPLEDVEVTTPLETMTAKRVAGKKVAVVPILRAGLGMVDGLLTLIPSAKVGHIGMYRDEETHEPHEYYCKLPPDVDQRTCLVVDPMLATGGSATMAIEFLRKAGVCDVRFLSIVSAPEGLQEVLDSDPTVRVFTCSIDRCLNENAYILPGLGDAGDRIFGTL